MKPYFLFVAIGPLFLVGCAPSGYVSDYPVYAGPGYYDPGYYYAGPPVTVSYYSGGNYHSYHHYAQASHSSYASNRTYTSYRGSNGPRVAGIDNASKHQRTAVSRGAAHVNSSHTHN